MRNKIELTRAERLYLIAAAARSILSGAIRAIVTWILDHHS
jgi:hypothetical protein